MTMSSRRTQVFSIDRYWKRCTIYEAGRDRQIVGRSTITINKGVARPERYKLIGEWLVKHGLKCPTPPVNGKVKGRRRAESER